MDERHLPQPTSFGEVYLREILLELQGLRQEVKELKDGLQSQDNDSEPSKPGQKGKRR